MEKEMFKRALEHYRNQDDLEEVEIVKGVRYEFFDEYDGYTFPINNISALKPSNYFEAPGVDGMKSVCKSVEEFVDLDKLNKILGVIKPEMFFTLSNIFVLKNEREMSICEECLGRELLEGALGQSTYDTNAIIVNLFNIIEGVKDIESNAEDFCNTVIYQFYTTFLHELGHVSLRDNLLNAQYSPLTALFFEFDDEEDLVEWYAKSTFDYMDSRFDVFEPFNKEYILKHFAG